jgi:hypothetical protein
MQQFALQQQNANRAASRQQAKQKSALTLADTYAPNVPAPLPLSRASDYADPSPPVDMAAANAQAAKFRLSAVKSFIATGKPDVALRYANQIVRNHPNSPQATEAKAIIKSLTAND